MSAEEKNSAEQAIRDLLLRWQQTHATELAQAITSFSEAVESEAAKAIRAQDKVPQDQWLAGANVASVTDRGAFLATLTNGSLNNAKERFGIVSSWGDDPRVTALIHRMIETLPWVSHPAKSLWRSALDRLAAIDDPRTQAVADAFDPSSVRPGSRAFAEYLKRGLTRTLKEASNRPTALSKKELAGLEKLPKPTGASGDDSDPYELLRSDPLDQSIMVIGDRLMDIGDPRGRLIALQQRESELTRKEKSEVKKLLKEHHAELLGPLAALLKKKNLVFRNGFVHKAEAKDVVHAPAIEAAIASPLATTVTQMSGNGIVAANPQFTRLATVTDIMLESIRTLTAPLPWKSVHGWLDKSDLDLLDKIDVLPELRQLSLFHSDLGSPENVVRTLKSPLVRHVDRFRVEAEYPKTVGQLLSLIHKNLRKGKAHSVYWEQVQWGLSSMREITLTKVKGAIDVHFSLRLSTGKTPERESGVKGLVACAKELTELAFGDVRLTLEGPDSEPHHKRTLKKIHNALGLN